MNASFIPDARRVCFDLNMIVQSNFATLYQLDKTEYSLKSADHNKNFRNTTNLRHHMQHHQKGKPAAFSLFK